jgi:PAS domain S-box-containing protein
MEEDLDHEGERKAADRGQINALVPDSDDNVWLALALAAARMGVWEWDVNSDAVTWSRTTALAFGLVPNEAPRSGREAFALVHPDDRDRHREQCERAIREGTELVAEYRIVDADGGVRWMQSRGRVNYDAAGNPERILGVNIDISNQKLLETQLLEAHRQAERLKVLKATMRTVQDVVYNALMSLQLFRTDAEAHVSPESLELFDQIIADTTARLGAIANLEHVVETEMVTGPGIDY